MARSSGGGSRSGGSRGGSRSRSRSGGSRSGGATKSSICSKRPRAGCRKYRYFDKHGREQFIYCNYDPNPDNKNQSKKLGETLTKVVLSFFYLPFFIAIICMAFSIVNPVYPISKESNPDSKICIYDNLNVIENETELTDSLTAFYEKTGVTPAVVTVSHDKWEYYYNDLEKYSLEQYYKLFDDEVHWLIVYSEPTGEDFNDWAWEGIIGDDTTLAISDERCEQLTNTMQKNLYRGTGVGKAIADTFNTMTETYKTTYNFFMIPFFLFFGGFVILHFCLMTGIIGGKKYYKGAELVDETVISEEQEEPLLNYLLDNHIVKCSYCGSAYSAKETLTCPHCNAPITLPNTTKSDEKAPEGIYVKDSNSDMV